MRIPLHTSFSLSGYSSLFLLPIRHQSRLHSRYGTILFSSITVRVALHLTIIVVLRASLFSFEQKRVRRHRRRELLRLGIVVLVSLLLIVGSFDR